MVKQQVNDIGPAHFKSIIKQQRNNNYNLIKVLCEFIDNIIKKCKNINITTTLNDTKLYEIKISDNYEKGFENINEIGAKNPLNMGHIRDGQDDDNETSEFGIGMKAAAIASSNKFTIYTKVNDTYYKIYFDFIKMSQETDIIKSYNPNIKVIDEDEYKEYHIYDNGSTLILQDIRDEIYSATTDENITKYIKTQLGSIYGKIIDKYNVEIMINNNIVQSEYDFFENEKSKIFTQTAKLYYLENSNTKIKFFLIEYPNNKFYIYKDKKININNNNLKYYIDNNFELKYSDDKKECLIIDTTFTYFIDNTDIDNKTFDIVEIYKDNRKYGNLPLQRRNNGVHNYTLHKVTFKSKAIGKQLGMTYNKEILLNNNNDLVNCVDAIITKNKENFTADTSTNKFINLQRIYNDHFKVNDNETEESEEPKEPEEINNTTNNNNKNNKNINKITKKKDTKVIKKINIPNTKNISIINLLNKDNKIEEKIQDKIEDTIQQNNINHNTDVNNITNTDVTTDVNNITNTDVTTEENNNSNYFYIIHTAGRQNTNIYKIGKTSNEPLKRLRAYERGYKIYLVLKTYSDNFENIVIENLKKSFTQETEYGTEWFSGDINKIIKCILELYSQHELS